MTQKLTILFDLDGTLVDTAPDLMGAHNHVMKKFGFHEKKLVDIKRLAGRGAWIMMQRSFKEEITDEKIKKEMVREFIDHYAKNIDKGSKPIKGIVTFLKWAAEPELEVRKNLGIKVILFFLVLGTFIYFAKNRLWREID